MKKILVDRCKIAFGKDLVSAQEGKAMEHYAARLDVIDKSVYMFVRNAAFGRCSKRKIVLEHRLLPFG